MFYKFLLTLLAAIVLLVSTLGKYFSEKKIDRTRIRLITICAVLGITISIFQAIFQYSSDLKAEKGAKESRLRIDSVNNELKKLQQKNVDSLIASLEMSRKVISLQDRLQLSQKDIIRRQEETNNQLTGKNCFPTINVGTNEGKIITNQILLSISIINNCTYPIRSLTAVVSHQYPFGRQENVVNAVEVRLNPQKFVDQIYTPVTIGDLGPKQTTGLFYAAVPPKNDSENYNFIIRWTGGQYEVSYTMKHTSGGKIVIINKKVTSPMKSIDIPSVLKEL
ncbi:hypothetical protein [Segetibacter koreensis]|uniref:hypothetical protein n=1 Tax=Segetibacter koreensis TaxID=398037 RepID=UPI00035E0AF2|nr:hypothetical protein [Segetibacter koreensis]